MSQQSDFEKFKKVVNSCQNKDHIQVAYKYGMQLYIKYGDLYSVFDPFLDNINDIIKHKENKLIHEYKMRGEIYEQTSI